MPLNFYTAIAICCPVAQINNLPAMQETLV